MIGPVTQWIGVGMQFLRVRNFERFQHYKDRKPIWIKLYLGLMEDYYFCQLNDAHRYHVIAIMLLASRYQNQIPYDKRWIAAEIKATGVVDFDALVNSRFIEVYDDASKTLASCYQDASLEKRIEEKNREEKTPLTPLRGDASETTTPKGVTSPKEDSPGFASFWSAWPKHFRKVGKSNCVRIWSRKRLEPLTEQVLKSLERCKASLDWKKENGQFIPQPASWLNDTPWETDPGDLVGAAPSDGFDDFRGNSPSQIAPDVMEFFDSLGKQP